MASGIERRSLPEQIKDALIARMASGELNPGDRLIELKIAQEMQTSQAPVREALRDLEALSLIEMRRNRGAIVREITEAELAEIYAVRAELEGHAVEQAVIRSSDLRQPLHALCADMEAAVSKDDRAAFVDLNNDFHRAIVEAGGNAVLAEIWTKLDIRARTAVNVTRSERPLQRAVQEHRLIARAIESGNGAHARDLLRRHIMAVLDRTA